MRDDTYELTLLYDFFGELLTDTQREYFEYYFLDDLSLSEISELTGVTRQAVRAVLQRAQALLRHYEEKTGAVARFREIGRRVGELQGKLAQLAAAAGDGSRGLAEEIYAGLEELEG